MELFKVSQKYDLQSIINEHIRKHSSNRIDTIQKTENWNILVSDHSFLVSSLQINFVKKDQQISFSTNEHF